MGIRAAFASLDKTRNLRIVIVAFEEDVEQAFRHSLAKMVRRVNKDLLERIPLIIFDAILPNQHLTFDVDNLPVAIRKETRQFGMIGCAPTPHGMAPLSCGVEVMVLATSA